MMQQKTNQESKETAPPVEMGQEIIGVIEALGTKGDGLFKVNGYCIFVPKVAVGERAKVRIYKVLRNVAFADKVD